MNSLRLGDYCFKIGSGATPRGGKETYLKFGPCSLIRSQNVYNDRFLRDGLAYISKAQADALANVNVEPLDVLVNITGDSVARTCQVDSRVLPARVNQHVAIIRPDPDVIDPSYLRYWLVTREVQQRLMALASAGATRPALTKKMLEDLEFPAIDIGIQKAVAELLSELDEKIELNRQMNETLEASAQALFRDWFVEFAPTKAKMAGTAPYLASGLWSLFPEKLEEDGSPRGWAIEELDNHIITDRGLSYKGSGLTNKNNGLALYNLNSIREGGGLKESGIKWYDGVYKDKHRVQPGDLLVANTEQGFDHLLIGFSAIASQSIGESIYSHHLYKVTPKSTSHLTRRWLHYAFSASPIGERVRRFANGTTVNMLPKDALSIPELAIPPDKLVSAFDDIVSQISTKQEQANNENHTLAQTRDLLLPKLMSGEIHVGEAEQTISEIA